jgi:Zn finger protein HypA/HybF involved in hydrogenase expression
MEKKIAKELIDAFKDVVKKNNNLRIIKTSDKITIDIGRGNVDEKMLEKAMQDYPEGTIIEPLYPKSAMNFQKIETVAGIGHKCSPEGYVYEPKTHGYLYYLGEWAKILKKPLFKIGNRFIYHDDEYFLIDKKDNCKLEIMKGDNFLEYTPECDSKEFIRFATKEEALDYILKEAKAKFKTDKFKFKDFTKFINVNELEINGDYISTKEYNIWRASIGWIAEPLENKELDDYDLFLIKTYLDKTDLHPLSFTEIKDLKNVKDKIESLIKHKFATEVEATAKTVS